MGFLTILPKFFGYLGSLRDNPKAANIAGGVYTLMAVAGAWAFADQQGWIDQCIQVICHSTKEQLLNYLFGGIGIGVAADTIVTHVVAKKPVCPDDEQQFPDGKNAGSKTGKM